MEKYPKIQTIFKRDKNKKIIIDDWSLPEFEYLKDCLWNWDEKIDGQNTRIDWNCEDIYFDGRNENSSFPANLANYLFKKFNYLQFKTHFEDCPVTLYGEGFGFAIQGKMGVAYSKELPFKCGFNLFDVRIGDYWLERHNVKDIADKLVIDTAPNLGVGTFAEAIKLCKNGFDSTIGDCQAEGLVMRPVVEMLDRQGERIIAKLKVRDFK